jgi:hypothetical protein
MEMVEIDLAVARIARSISDRSVLGLLPDESVQGLDVLYHALIFTQTPDALSIWRTALWERTLTDQGRAVMTEMLNYLNREVRDGRGEAVSGVCDCLTAIFSARTDMEREPVALAGLH